MDVRGTLQKLFVHEHLRVYGDSLVSSDDLSWLEQLLWRLLRPKFDCRLTQDQVAGDTLLFGEWVQHSNLQQIAQPFRMACDRTAINGPLQEHPHVRHTCSEQRSYVAGILGDVWLGTCLCR
jgi:hypothetical protein